MARPKKATPAKAPLAAAVEAAKETAAKKTQKIEETVYLQAGGSEWDISDCKERAVAAFVAEGHKASAVKKLAVYLKPEEGKAYYVINDSENGSISL